MYIYSKYCGVEFCLGLFLSRLLAEGLVFFFLVIKGVGVDSDETHNMDGVVWYTCQKRKQKKQPATCNLCVESDFSR